MSAVLSSHEKALAGGLVMAVLYAVLLFVLGDRLTPAYWSTKNAIRHQLAEQRNEQRTLISQKDEWDRRYADLRFMMPVFTSVNGVESHWRDVIYAVADRHGVIVSFNREEKRADPRKADKGENDDARGACEMPFTGTWNASLDALVRFLYDLRAAGVMLDIRKIVINPVRDRPGQLHGSFTLHCVYMLGDEEYIPSSETTSVSSAAPSAGNSPANQETP